MKKILIALVAGAAMASVNAGDWFTGTVGFENAGSWTVPTDGSVTTNGTTLALEGVTTSSPLTFTASESKTPTTDSNGGFTKLVIATTATFETAYDTTPETTGKAGVVVVGSKYFVLGKASSDATANTWCDSGIEATLNTDVNVTITIAATSSDVYVATYAIGSDSVTTGVVAGACQYVDYAGSGTVSYLAGTTYSQEVAPSGSDTAPALQDDDKAAAETWAKNNGIDTSSGTIEISTTDTDKTASGLSSYDCCLLGINTNETVATVTTVGTSSSTVVALTLTNASPNLVYTTTVGSETSEASSVATVDLSKVTGRQEITITAKYTNGTKTETITIKQSAEPIAKSTTAQYLAVPVTGDITSIIPASNLAKNDQVEIFNPATSQFNVWKWNGTAWEDYNTGKTVASTTVTPGQAIKFTATDSENTRYIVGSYSESALSSVSVTAGKYNMIANPNSTATTSIEKFNDDDKMYTQSSTSVLPETSYYKTPSGWHKKNADNSVDTSAPTVIPAGGFFLKAGADTSKLSWQ